MAIKWTWFTGALRYDHKCAGCAKQLIHGADAGIVEWGDDKAPGLERFHVVCLLDKLAKEAPAAPVFDTEAMIGWGMVSPP